MELANNVILRKIYQILYFNFLKSSKGKGVEEKILNIFYK